MSEGEARGILEIAKVTGRVEIMPYFTLYTREFLNHPGRIIEIDATHLLRVEKPFPDDELAPFVFVLSDVSTGTFQTGLSDTEEQAAKMIELILAVRKTKNLGYLKGFLSNIPEYISETKKTTSGVVT